LDSWAIPSSTGRLKESDFPEAVPLVKIRWELRAVSYAAAW
jgi:hypothetical protein